MSAPRMLATASLLAVPCQAATSAPRFLSSSPLRTGGRQTCGQARIILPQPRRHAIATRRALRSPSRLRPARIPCTNRRRSQLSRFLVRGHPSRVRHLSLPLPFRLLDETCRGRAAAVCCRSSWRRSRRGSQLLRRAHMRVVRTGPPAVDTRASSPTQGACGSPCRQGQQVRRSSHANKPVSTRRRCRLPQDDIFGTLNARAVNSDRPGLEPGGTLVAAARVRPGGSLVRRSDCRVLLSLTRGRRAHAELAGESEGSLRSF